MSNPDGPMAVQSGTCNMPSDQFAGDAPPLASSYLGTLEALPAGGVLGACGEAVTGDSITWYKTDDSNVTMDITANRAFIVTTYSRSNGECAIQHDCIESVGTGITGINRDQQVRLAWSARGDYDIVITAAQQLNTANTYDIRITSPNADTDTDTGG